MCKNILVADDIRMNRALVIDILRQKLEDANFFEAKTGAEAIEIVKSGEIDLLILDLIMPEMDGFAVLDHLNSSADYSDIPVIVSSAIRDIESIEQTLKNGANDYFTKPLSPNDMNIILPLKVKNLLTMYEQKKMIKNLSENIQTELENAVKFQTIMLPRSMEDEKLSINIKFDHSNKIGGDFFDYVKIDDKYWFIISDISKCGIVAGMTTAILKILFRTAVKSPEIKPGKVLESINDGLFEFMYFDNLGNQNASKCLAFKAFVGQIDVDKFSFAGGGHSFPILYKNKEESLDTLEISDFSIGSKRNLSFDTKEDKISSGDVLILYTDGVFSKKEKDEFARFDSVREYIKNNISSLKKSESLFLDDMLCFFKMMKYADVNEDNGEDDVTIMAIKIK